MKIYMIHHGLRVLDVRVKKMDCKDSLRSKPTLYVCGCTYVKTKNREVEPTRRQTAVHTGMKALGFNESAPLAGILSPNSSVIHTNETTASTHTHTPSKSLFVFGQSLVLQPQSAGNQNS